MESGMNEPLVILGCTASGKSELAEAIAAQWKDSTGRCASIMAVDAMQVYRGMDIGTAKPDAPTRRRFAHWMIDVADPWESFSAARFATMAEPLIREHQQAGQPLILVAGTVLYLRAVLEGLFEGPAADPALRQALARRAARQGAARLHRELADVDAPSAARIHPNDLRRIVRALEVFHLTGEPISRLQTQWRAGRPRIACRMVGIRREKEDLNHRINRRVRMMIQTGLVEEVQRLAAGPHPLSMQAREGVGYKEILEYLEGRITLAQAGEQMKIHTRHLAKLQRTWLRRFPQIRWLNLAADQAAGGLAGMALEEIISQNPDDHRDRTSASRAAGP